MVPIPKILLGGDVRCFLSGIPEKNFHDCLVVGFNFQPMNEKNMCKLDEIFPGFRGEKKNL